MDVRKCAGLYTFASELEQPAGALFEADNIVIDKEDTIEPRRGIKEYGDSFSTSGVRLKQILEYKSTILRHFGTTLQFDNGSGTFSSFNGSFSELETGLRIKYKEINGNLYFTTNDGVKKISASSTSEFSTAASYITNAGVPKALDTRASLSFATTGFLSAQSKAAYRVAWGITDKNNNLIIGVPSNRFVVENTSQNIQSSVLTVSGALTAAQYFLLDVNDGISTTKYFIWFDNGGTTAPTGSDTVGRTPVECPSVVAAGTNALRVSLIGNAISNGVSGVNVSIDTAAGTVTLMPSISIGTISISTGLGGTTNFSVANSSISSTSAANVALTFTVPQGITTDYFFQIYRTQQVQISDSLTLSDIDPGDEMNLIYESFYTSGSTVSFTDTVPDVFRESGTPLYTNPVSGDTIAQANDRPPLAKDLTYFRNSMFYSNTKTLHRKQFNLLTALNFISGTSQFVVGNATTTRTYTFRGSKEVTPIVCDSRTNTTSGGYILLNSASDERKYYIWIDKTGSDTDPAVSGKIGIRVNISASADTAVGSALALYTALGNISDFTLVNSGTGTVTVTCVKNGNATNASIGSALGGAWAIGSITQGTGEDSSTNKVLLSSLTSVGQAIEETALSLVNIINLDSSCPVYAYYLSGPADIPGIILLENRSLSDTPFYLSVNESAIQGNFNPSFPLIKSITAIGTNDQITTVAHGLSTGSRVYIYSTDSTPTLLGEYSVTKVDNDKFTVGVDITVLGTTGKWFLSSVKSDNENFPNRVYFSKTSQPDCVPITNYLEIGSKNSEIKRIIGLRDYLFVLKDEGVYIVTGNAAPNFDYRLLDSSTKILCPDSAIVLNNQIFCLANQGVVRVSEVGVPGIVSRGIEDKIKNVTNANFANYKSITFGVSYENDRAYLLWLPSVTSDTLATQCYRYNVYTNTWTRFVISATCGLVSSLDDKLYLGAGDTNYIYKEKKNGDRTDFSDREISFTINKSGVNSKTISLSSSVNVAIGDVLVQTQYVTIALYNRLLRKLDLDPANLSSDFESSLLMVPGDNLQTKLQALDTKLQGSVIGYTTTVFASDFPTIQTNWNTMVGKLNSAGTFGTSFKNYETSSGTTFYEAIITGLKTNNKVTVNVATNFIEGATTLHKGYKKKITWVPQHFGEAQSLKQVSQGTVILHKNNFYSGSVFYATDISQSFTEVPIFGQGTGSFGDFAFGSIDFGGEGNDAPARTILPPDKQRCRYVTMKFEHVNARENVTILGYTLKPRRMSDRAYR
jgi:hypothetical protein